MSELVRDHHLRRSGRSATARWMRSAAARSLSELLAECAALDAFRRASDNLYERVRALFFLYAIHRFHLPQQPGRRPSALIPFEGYAHLLRAPLRGGHRHLSGRAGSGRRPSDGICQRAGRGLSPPGLPDAGRPGAAQRALGARQPVDVPHRPSRRPSAARAPGAAATRCRRRGLFPDPARSDAGAHGPHPQRLERHLLPGHGLSRRRARAQRLHRPRACAARRRRQPRPPVEAYFRVIDEPVLRLVSVDLGAAAEITTLAEVFDFAKDYLGLLKAAVIAAGIVPPGMEGAGQPLADLLARLVRPGPRPRAGQPGQRHPQRIAPGRLHQPAGLPDRRLHARHGPDRVADRASWPKTSAAWWPRAPSWASGWAGPAAAGRIRAASGRA